MYRIVFDDKGIHDTWIEAHIYRRECEDNKRVQLCDAIIDALAELYRMDYEKQITDHQDTIEHG